MIDTIDTPGLELLARARDVGWDPLAASEVLGRGIEWNRAEGFMVCFWEEHGMLEMQLSPWSRNFDFSSMVRDRFEAECGSNWETKIYDRTGRERRLAITAKLVW